MMHDDLADAVADVLAAGDQARLHCPGAALAVPVQAGKTSGQQFDWDRYHDRQDACREKDRSAAECVGGVDYCDEPAVRQARRACSAFGPLGERR